MKLYAQSKPGADSFWSNLPNTKIAAFWLSYDCYSQTVCWSFSHAFWHCR